MYIIISAIQLFKNSSKLTELKINSGVDGVLFFLRLYILHIKHHFYYTFITTFLHPLPSHPDFLLIWHKGQTINDLGGGLGQNPEKKIWPLRQGKKSCGAQVLLNRTATQILCPRPPPQIINGPSLSKSIRINLILIFIHFPNCT